MTNFDLKTLNLADGTHSITVVAKASGYKDSLPSNAVSYVVGSGGTITDLTGYTWVGNDVLLAFSNNWTPLLYNLNFTSNNEQFTQIGTANKEDSVQEFSLIYTNSTTTKYIYDFEYTSSYYSEMEAYKTIQITGGTDVTNSTLIAWLQTNGTLTKTVVEETYTIPAGTYVFKETPDMSSYDKYVGIFSFVSNTVKYNEIRYLYGENIKYNNTGESEKDISVYTTSDGWLAEIYRTITVETDQTVSEDFYNWFVESTYTLSGVYVFKETISEIPDQEQVEFKIVGVDLTTKGYRENIVAFDTNAGTGYDDEVLYILVKNDDVGSYVYYRPCPDGVWKEIDGYSTRYINFGSIPKPVSEKFYNWFTANATQLITFTIDGTTYQAENGMTWAEWVSSEYNTSGYVVNSYDSIILNGETSNSAVLYNANHVKLNEVIIAGADYDYGSHSGGSNN